MLAAYKQWHEVTRHIPKMRRYSLGIKIDALFSDIIELVSIAQFSLKSERTPVVARAIARNDVLKFMLYVLLELKGMEQEQFIAIASRLEEVGRMLYGWKGHIEKENRSATE